MSNEKFYEAFLRKELPISIEFAEKGWPELLYPWFLATVQLPEGDQPARRAFTQHMGDCIRAGVLPAVKQRIPWFTEQDVVEPHVSAQDFSAWLAKEGREPSQLVSEWFKAWGGCSIPNAESIDERNKRWLAVKKDEESRGGTRGAQARAVAHIAATEGIKPDTVKSGIQRAQDLGKEANRAGGTAAPAAVRNSANNPFNAHQKRVKEDR